MLEIKIESKMATEKIENAILAGEKLSEEKIKKLLNYEMLPTDEKTVIDEFCSKIDFSDSEQTSKYGEMIQNEIVKFSDSVFKGINSENAERVVELFSKLLEQVKEFDNVVPITLRPKGVSRLFFNIQKKAEKIISKFSEIEAEVTKIEKQLETQKIKLLKDVTAIDSIYKEVMEKLRMISLYIIAGERKLEDEITSEAPEKIINIFKNKISNLKDARNSLMNILPEIRLIQSNDSKLAEKIQETLRNSLPIWRNQSLIAIGVSNNVLENEQDINVEALRKNNQDILEILHKVLKIDN